MFIPRSAGQNILLPRAAHSDNTQIVQTPPTYRQKTSNPYEARDRAPKAVSHQSPIYIVGAGPTGLLAAIKLAKERKHLVVFEKRDEYARNAIFNLRADVARDLIKLGVPEDLFTPVRRNTDRVELNQSSNSIHIPLIRKIRRARQPRRRLGINQQFINHQQRLSSPPTHMIPTKVLESVLYKIAKDSGINIQKGAFHYDYDREHWFVQKDLESIPLDHPISVINAEGASRKLAIETGRFNYKRTTEKKYYTAGLVKSRRSAEHNPAERIMASPGHIRKSNIREKSGVILKSDKLNTAWVVAEVPNPRNSSTDDLKNGFFAILSSKQSIRNKLREKLKPTQIDVVKGSETGRFKVATEIVDIPSAKMGDTKVLLIGDSAGTSSFLTSGGFNTAWRDLQVLIGLPELMTHPVPDKHEESALTHFNKQVKAAHLDWHQISVDQDYLRPSPIIYKLYELRFPHSELISTVLSNYYEAVESLLSSGANVNIRHPKTGDTAISVAVARGYTKIVELLIEKGADLSATYQGGKKTILDFAYLAPRSQASQKLLTAKNPNLVNGKGEPVLITAVRAGDVPGAKRLLTLGANIDATDRRNGSTAILFAAQNGDIPMLEFLLAYEPDTAVRSRNTSAGALDYAQQPSNSDEVIRLLTQHNPNLANRKGEPILITTVRAGDLPGTQRLLALGANIDAVDRRNGSSALMFAAQQGNIPIMELLLSQNASTTADHQRSGKTLVDFARQPRNRDAVLALLKTHEAKLNNSKDGAL